MGTTRKNAHLRIRAVAVLSLFAALPAAAAFGQNVIPSWRTSDIGGPLLSGTATMQCVDASPCVISLTGAGTDISGNTDQFTFTQRTLTGNGVLIARVDGLDRSDDGAMAGLMIRESLRAGSKHAFAFITADGVLSFQRRTVTDAVSVASTGSAGSSPLWLKLERLDATFTAYQSVDGVTWVEYASDTLDMPATVYAGLAVTSHVATLRTTARFSSVGVATVLPDGWQSADIGTTGVVGATMYSSASFLMQAAGRDIGGSSDEFRYTFQRFDGDVDVVARVGAIVGLNALAKAGLMIRSSLSGSDTHASIFVTAAKGLAFQRRTIAGTDSVQTDGGAGTAPVWLKLEKRGNRIAAFRSSNGVSWTFIGDEVLTLPDEFYVGLAASSHAATQFANAVFEQVTVRPVASANVPPSISLTSPASGTAAPLGSSITLAATASDPDGFVAAVDFLIDGTLVTSDSEAPYQAAWLPPIAGSYTVTAVARDNAAASTASPGAMVLIQELPTRVLTFTPSPDHEALVDYYMVEIFPADQTGSEGALQIQSIGKPPIVDGAISTDVGALLALLPSGRYVAVVDAVGIASGSTRSDASPPFTR